MPTQAKRTIKDKRFDRLGLNVSTLASMIGRPAETVELMIEENDPIVEVALKAFAFDRLLNEAWLYNGRIDHIRKIVEDRVYAARAKNA